MENLLEVKDLRMYFKNDKKTIYAVDGVSFSIKEGESLGLVGESGCGKSTVIRCIARLYEPIAGQVIFNGKNILELNKKELISMRQNLQMVFQDPFASLNPRMTCFDLICEPLKIYKRRKMLEISNEEIIKRCENLMELTGLSKSYKNRYPHEFSGGQMQRIGIARALALNPKLILLDEPVSALDVSIQSQVLNLLLNIQKELKLSYLFVSHDLACVKYISNRIAVMYLGKIAEIAESHELIKNPIHPYTKALLSSVPSLENGNENKMKRIILKGDVPSPDIKRQGCGFYDRCPYKKEECKIKEQKLTHVNDCDGFEHLSSCIIE